MKKIMQCSFCSIEFEGYICPSRSSKFCSKICFDKSLENETKEDICLTCKNKFKHANKNTRKFCRPKCIRYQGNRDEWLTRVTKMNRDRGFWKNASLEEKLNKLKINFEKKVIKKDGCWDWKGTRAYYALVYYNGAQYGSHRASWLIHKGEIPKGMFVCHSCDNPICTNPDHLFLGTPKDNTQDMCLKNRNHRILPGEKHPSAKLKESDVVEIKKLIQANIKLTTIAKQFNISDNTVRDIKMNRRWRHLNGK